MRHLAAVLVLAVAAPLKAGLIPIRFLDNPPVQRLTRLEAIEHWDRDFFERLHGMAITPMPRLGSGDSLPILMVFSDEVRNGLCYGMSFEKDGGTGVDWFVEAPDRFGRHADSFYRPEGLTLDTFQYGTSDEVYAYVADRLSGRVVRYRVDVGDRTLTYVDDLLTSNGWMTDVSAVADPDSGGAYVACLDEYNCRVSILHVDSDKSVHVAAEYGERGGEGGFHDPAGICLTLGSTSGHYYVYLADRGNCRIVRLVFDAAEEQFHWDKAAWMDGAAFTDVAVNPNGLAYAVDIVGNRIVALTNDLGRYSYSYNGNGLTEPREVTMFGDELAVCELWGDSSGIQYFRIVPQVNSFDCDGSFDATADSITVTLRLGEVNAFIDLSVLDQGDTVRHVAVDSALAVDHEYSFLWDGRCDDGSLALPGEHEVRLRARFRQGETDPDVIVVCTLSVTVQGTRVPATISCNTTWDSLDDPCVLTDNFSINGGYGSAKLTIQRGVRVMFHDSATCQSIEVGSADRIEALGTSQKPVYFMPHRKMAEAFNPVKRGWWGGLHFAENSNGARFSNCIFENGGDNADQSVVYFELPADSMIFDGCRFDGALYSAIRADPGTAARDWMRVGSCEFRYCGDYPINKVGARAVAGVSATCTFQDNDVNGLLVHAGSGDDEMILNSCTWHSHDPGFFYAIADGDLIIKDTFGINTTLTIEPGAKFCVAKGCGIRTELSGAIAARGTQGAPIIFDGIDNGIISDTWDGIRLDRYSLGSSSFRFCVFRNGVGSVKHFDAYDYFPMFWCDQVPCTLSCCAFLGAQRDDGDGTGIYIDRCAPYIRRCVFHRNETGIMAHFSGEQCYAESCQVDSGEVGYRVEHVTSASRYGILHSNIVGNSASGAYNFDASESLYARHNWWGPDSGGRAGMGSNNQVSGFVRADSAESTRYDIWSKDAQAVSIVRPPFVMEPGAVEPMGIAQNNFYDQVTLTATMRIVGANYADTVQETLAAFEADSVKFDTVVLDTGTYPIVFKVSLAGDSIFSNDSMVRIVRVSPIGAGWTEIAPLPAPPSGRPVKDGGCMAYDVGTNRIYTSKGNKTADFYAYNVSQGTWTQLDTLRLGREGKRASVGSAICADGNGKVYLTKGNNTLGFYEYDALLDSWVQKKDVSLGWSGKKVKRGAGLAWAMKDSFGAVYLLKGYTNEFLRYNPATDSWETLQRVPSTHQRWNVGSWLVADPRPNGHELYAFQAKYHGLYVYDVCSDNWNPEPLRPMPVPGHAGNKKAKDGCCAAWYGGDIYALKGGNTCEFWRYTPSADTWHELDDIPLFGSTHARIRVKAGAALAGCPDTGVYAIKGNKSREFWWYKLGQSGGGEAVERYSNAGNSVVASGGPTLNQEDPMVDGVVASNPRWNQQGTMVCYSRPDTMSNLEQICQCQYGMSTPEQQVVAFSEDCEEPVYSPDGQYIAFQVDDDASGFYQLFVTMSSDTGPGGGGGPCSTGGASMAPIGAASAVAAGPALAPAANSAIQAPTQKSAAVTKQAATAARGRPRGPALFGPVWQITNDSADHCYPEWSPDGEWLCYERDDANGYTQVWRVPAFGGTEQQLTFGNSDHYLPEYLNGTDIVFTLSPDSGYDKIAKVNDSTHQVTVLTPFNTDHANPSPSWNGYDVAAEAVDSAGNTQIVHTAGPAGETWLTSGDADITEPDFGQDNQTIFAVHWTGITSEIVWVDAVSGGYTAVTDDQAIRDNPDARVDTALSTALAVYEREAWSPENLLLGGGKPRRKHGSGVYLSKFRKPHPHEGSQGASLGIFALDKAKPNPATNRVTIRWQVPVEADVSLRVYNTVGQLVKVLASGRTKPGAYTSVWNGTDAMGRRLANGVYFYALDNGAKRISRKVVLTE
jgi:hypothetical protein